MADDTPLDPSAGMHKMWAEYRRTVLLPLNIETVAHCQLAFYAGAWVAFSAVMKTAEMGLPESLETFSKLQIELVEFQDKIKARQQEMKAKASES